MNENQSSFPFNLDYPEEYSEIYNTVDHPEEDSEIPISLTIPILLKLSNIKADLDGGTLIPHELPEPQLEYGHVRRAAESL